MAGPIKRRHNTACSAKQECQGRRRAWVNGAVAISNCLIVSGQGACVFILPWAYAKYVASPPNRTQKHSTHPSGGYTWRTLGPRVESGWPNQAAIWMEKDDSGGCGGGGGGRSFQLENDFESRLYLLMRISAGEEEKAWWQTGILLQCWDAVPDFRRNRASAAPDLSRLPPRERGIVSPPGTEAVLAETHGCNAVLLVLRSQRSGLSFENV